MNSKVPKELIARQEHQRQTTINIVLRAISELRAEGHRLTIKNLMDYTGLSRSVFGKKHIRVVLVSQGIVATEACGSECTPPPKPTAKQRMKRKLDEKEQQILRLTEENTALKSECELLRGKLFLLMQRQPLE